MPNAKPIPAGAAKIGAWYTTPRDSRVKILGRPEGSTDVQVENDLGRTFTIPESYPLTPTEAAAGPALEDLVGLAPGELGEALERLGLDELDELEDLDPRPEVLEATAARRAQLERPPAPSLRQAVDGAAKALAAGAAAASFTVPADPTATCHLCRQAVRVMGQVLAVHSAAGVYCPASGTDPKPVAAEAPPAPPAPSAELEDEDAEAELQAPEGDGPEAAELEAEAAEPLDPWRHLAGAATVTTRIEAVRKLTRLADVAELEDLGAQLGAKVVRDLGSHRKALEAVAEATAEAFQGGKVGIKGRAALSHLAELQGNQARPGVMAEIRAAFARLQGLGVQVDHRIQPAPAELEGRPETFQVAELEAAPAELRELLAWIFQVSGWSTVLAEAVATVQLLAGTVRESRAAITSTEDVELVILAWRWEASRPEPRATILGQLEARIVALGGTVPQLEATAETVADSSAEAAELEPRHACETPGCDGSGVDCDDGTPDPTDPPARPEVREIPYGDPNGENHRPDELTGPVIEPWNLSALPLPLQVARSTTARALELVDGLECRDGPLVARVLDAERRHQDRPEVVARLVSFLEDPQDWPATKAVEAAPPPKPAQELPPEIEPAAPERVEPKVPRPQAQPDQVVQVQDLEIVALPDGRQELWAKPPGRRPVRVGDCADPRLAPHLAALKAHQAAHPAPVDPRAMRPTPPPPPAVPEVVQVAQAGLAALAAALPALAALGLDVTFKITTRSPNG